VFIISSVITNLTYFVVALIWNVAILSVYSFFASWFFDILGALIENEAIRNNAYAVAMLATASMFSFGILAAILSKLVKCKSCGSPIIKPEFPFFISFKKFSCVSCKPKVPKVT